MTLFALSAEYEAMRARADAADAEYEQVCDWLVGYFRDGDAGAEQFLRLLAEVHAPEYEPPLRELPAEPLPEDDALDAAMRIGFLEAFGFR
jgi:hypothetical protein